MRSALIIGTGSIGERHLRCFQKSGLYSVSACEPNDTLRQEIAQKYGCPVHAELAQALAAGSFDVAVICTPANHHIPVAMECLRNGLHLLIEKPLALSMEGVGELANLSAAKNLTVRVAYTLRMIPALQQLKEIVRSGIIGTPRHVAVSAGQNFAALRPAYRTIYYRSHATGGGGVQDALTHQINAVEWIAGPVTKVFASAAHMVLEGVDVEDTVNLNAVLRDGTLAGFLFNQFQAPNEVSIQINGTLGSARFEMHQMRTGTFLVTDSEWNWLPREQENIDDRFVRQAACFRDAIEAKPTPLCTLEEAIQTLKVNVATLDSASRHQEITIS